MCVHFFIYILFFFTNDYLQINHETSTNSDNNSYMPTNMGKRAQMMVICCLGIRYFFFFFFLLLKPLMITPDCKVLVEKKGLIPATPCDGLH